LFRKPSYSLETISLKIGFKLEVIIFSMSLYIILKHEIGLNYLKKSSSFFLGIKERKVSLKYPLTFEDD
jgi:hypothetical protein